MKRFATLGLMLATAAAVSAGNPVSVYPPAPPAPSGSTLNQSLPSAIQSAMPAGAPAPALVSTPSWAAEPLIGSSQAIPTAGPSYLTVPPTVTPAGCTTCDASGSTRPYFNLLARPERLSAPTACGGCGTRGSCFDRLKAWLAFQPCASGVPLLEPAPYRVPLRAYFPCAPDGGCGPAGCAAGGCGPAARPNVLARLGLFQHKAACDATIPTKPLPTAAACGDDHRLRVVYVPLSAGGCADGKSCSPSLMGRLMSAFNGGGSCAGSGGCAGGNCPPPAPSPVRYAAPCTPTYYGPVSTQPAAAVPTVVPAQPVTNGKVVPAPMPAAKTSGTPASATQPFTNP